MTWLEPATESGFMSALSADFEPMDMRAGVDTALGRVVSVFDEARAHHAYLFVNKRANRMKVLVQDCFGLWLGARRLY